MPPADLPVRYYRYSLSAGWDPIDARVIAETSVDLTVNGSFWLSFACTPTELDALAVGFLFNEGVIHSKDEIAAVDVCKQGTNIDVWLHKTVERPETWQRTSGCTGGVTSGNAPKPRRTTAQPGPAVEQIQPETLMNCMEQLLHAQELYRETGGVHCSALSDGQKVHLRSEDIGRHNTLDKLAGRILLDEMVVSPVIILTTGRISSEMMQKAAQLGAVAVVSRTSPTSKSVSLAEELGITLVGYARRNGFLVYAHPERISALPAAAPDLPPGETLPDYSH
jgi:FdhD protein